MTGEVRARPSWRGAECSTVALAVCAALVVSACGSDSAGQVTEDRIRDQVEKQTGKEVTALKCAPGGGPEKAGLVCKATFEGGEQVGVEVVGTGLAGGVQLRIEGESPGERLARRITDSLTEHYGPEFRTTTCPPVEAREGLSFECTAVLRDGAKLPVTATWTDNRGDYEFADKGVIVLDELEAAVRAQLAAAGTPAKVDCRGTILPAEPDSNIECSVDYDDGKSGYAVVTVAGWDGEVSWELE